MGDVFGAYGGSGFIEAQRFIGRPEHGFDVPDLYRDAWRLEIVVN